MAFGNGGDYESQKMLDVYIYDYLMKRNMHEVAAIFAQEVNITISPLMIDSPTGFLSEWWSIFWDVHSARIPISHLAMPGGPSVQAAQRVVNEQLNKSPNMPKPNVNHQNSGKLPSPDFDNNMVGQSVATVNHQNFGKLPMSPGFDNNKMGQSSAASMNHHNFGKLPMSPDFDNNMMEQSVASVNHQNYGKLPMSPNFQNNMMGQSFAVSVNHQNSEKLPMSPGFDNNMMGQSSASVAYQNFEKFPMSPDFDNTMGQFVTSVDHQNFGTLPMSPDFDNNMMRQYATNVNDQNSGKLPMSPDFDNSLMGQFAASMHYQNSERLHMSFGFDNNVMGQSATSVNYQNSMKLPMTLGFNSNLMGQSSTTSVLASNFFEEEHSKIPAKDLNSIVRLLDVDNYTLSKASPSHASNSQLQIPERVAPQQTARDNNYGVAFGGTSSSVAFRGTSSSVAFRGTSSMDSSLFTVPKPLVPGAESHDTGMPKGANLASLKGQAIDELDKNPLRMAYPVLNSLPVPNQQHQFKIPPTPYRHQELSSQGMANKPTKQKSFQGCNSNIFSSRGMANAPISLMFPRVDLSPTTVQRLLPRRQTSQQQMTMPMKQVVEQRMIVLEKQTTNKQHKDQVMQQQVNENNKKRKSISSSQAEEKNASDGKNVVVEKPSDEDIESFLSSCIDDADIENKSFTKLQRRSTGITSEGKNGFSFKEFGSIHASKGKVLCCHFSSDGKLLASAGHDKKVLLWRVNSFDSTHTTEAHTQLITDVRFRPNSYIFATSSFDSTVQIWDANKPSKSRFKLLGHAGQVASLDFHPRKLDLLCSCDNNDEIRLWNINKCVCTDVFKGATRQVRFQPRIGNLLAAASGNKINLIDVETNRLQCYLKGHNKEVRSICWDISGKYMASVSEDSARIWSIMSGGKCVHVFHSNGNKFESCAFHPGYSQLMVIGSYKAINIWNPTESNKTMTVDEAHDGIVSSLADCSQTEIVASVSHDRTVKLWR